MKAILKFKPLLITLFFLSFAISTITASNKVIMRNNGKVQNQSISIICPGCGLWNWTLLGYWLEDEWITTAMICDNCYYIVEL